MSRASAAQIEHEIVRACHRGLDVPGLQREVLATLRRVMSIDAAFFATADPDTLLFTGAHAEEPLPKSQALFVENEFGAADVNKFATLATSSRHVASLDGATRHERASSGRYRDIMGPLGLGDELRAALVVDSRCWGYLCLHREDHELGFAPGDADLLARLGPHIAHGLRQAVLVHGPAGAGVGPRPAVLVLADEDLAVVGMNPEAEVLMSLVDEGVGPLPVSVRTVATALISLERGDTAAPPVPSTRARAADGHWLDVHASRLQGPPGEGRIAVVLERAGGHTIAQLLLAAHGLTPREVDVARLVIRGTARTTIANTLHISRHTLQDHLKSIFDKVGVRSRRELVGRLLGAPPPSV
ncbi:helix-turn-helix transcriptional regulator [Actinomycetospora endophytica]|uniref:Helix-turn-helix transcriptional regulator n=1 Tax=Actinomycetospora endophytica TaxID=2291215 RepID=A0ABS8PEY0_9PSEU|nr:helix-turn-helix transcriptional regulator [Actinomycetospora endophytica]MCD2196558.1 helix-turn-helix transcriptional regulator [Actinomycetospora endophytica]